MVKFGVAGNSNSFYAEGHKHTEEAAAWCRDRGLDLFEYSFGKGIKMTSAKANAIGQAFASAGIELSAHAPYYINFANSDDEKIQGSIRYVIGTLEKLKEFDNGDRIVVHPATQGKDERDVAVQRARTNLEKLADAIISAGLDSYKICLETMGKKGQIGTVGEIVDFCKIAPFFYPCVDFGHVNAREGGILKREEDFAAIIQYMSERLPEEKVKNMHVHFSKIMFGESGEIKHLTFEDRIYGPSFEPFSNVIKQFELQPHIICESDGTQAEDARTMKDIYFNL